MAITRSMTRKRFKTSDNNGSASWSELNQDLLFLIMMQLGVVDFIAFSGVCKSWRSITYNNKNMFMASKPPLSIFISSGAKRDCYLQDHVGRKFKTVLPNSNVRTCVGLTCGYLIMFGTGTHDFWLVNPITRDELHFPRYPFYVCTHTTKVRGILVFSPSLSGWVFVISLRSSTTISFSLSGKQARWTHLTSPFPIHDLHFFKGKIYTINTGYQLCEVRLNPHPIVSLVKMKNNLSPDLILGEFISSDDKLYVMDWIAARKCYVVEVNCDKMKWANPIKTIGEYAIFLCDFKGSAAIKPDAWTDPQAKIAQYQRFGHYQVTDRSTNKGRSLTVNMWYFPQYCSSKNVLQE